MLCLAHAHTHTCANPELVRTAARGCAAAERRRANFQSCSLPHPHRAWAPILLRCSLLLQHQGEGNAAQGNPAVGTELASSASHQAPSTKPNFTCFPKQPCPPLTPLSTASKHMRKAHIRGASCAEQRRPRPYLVKDVQGLLVCINKCSEQWACGSGTWRYQHLHMMCLSHSQAPGHAGCSAFKLKVKWCACTLVVCKRVPEVRPVCLTFESAFAASSRRGLRARVRCASRAPMSFVCCAACAVQ